MTAATITTRRAAARLGLTVRQVHHLIDTGRLTPSEKLDGPTGAYLFAVAEVERVAGELAAEARAQLAALDAGAAVSA